MGGMISRRQLIDIAGALELSVRAFTAMPNRPGVNVERADEGGARGSDGADIGDAEGTRVARCWVIDQSVGSALGAGGSKQAGSPRKPWLSDWLMARQQAVHLEEILCHPPDRRTSRAPSMRPATRFRPVPGPG